MGQAKLKKLAAAAEIGNPVYELAKANQSYYFTKALEARFRPGVISTKVEFPDTGVVNCNTNVLKYCKALGGTPVHGWIVDDNEESHKEEYECSAREHFVVLTSNGQYVDPTPYHLNGMKSVFIPSGETYTFAEIEAYRFRSNIMFYEKEATATGNPAATGKLLWMPNRGDLCLVHLFHNFSAKDANAILLDEDYYYRANGYRVVEESDEEDFQDTIAKLKAQFPDAVIMEV